MHSGECNQVLLERASYLEQLWWPVTFTDMISFFVDINHNKVLPFDDICGH